MASDLRNASPNDPVLDDAQKAVSAESAPERATNEKALQFALAKQQRMSDGRRINVALNAILQLNRNLASHPGEIDPGQQVVVG